MYEILTFIFIRAACGELLGSSDPAQTLFPGSSLVPYHWLGFFVWQHTRNTAPILFLPSLTA